MSEVTEALGKQIRLLRHQQEWTQEKLAEEADLHVSYVIALEKGKKSATIGTLKKLADAFDLSLAELFSFDSKAKTAQEYEVSVLLQEYTSKITALLT